MTKPIRILHVLGRTDIGGAESFLMSIYRNINRDKIQFDFAIHTNDKCDFDDEIERLGGKIYHLPKYKIYNHIKYVSEWKRLLNNKKFDVVHGHMDSTASVYLGIAKQKGISTISHIHNTNGEKNIKSVIKRIYRRNINDVADYKFACSDAAGKYLYGNQSDDYVVIHNGIELEKFLYDSNKRLEIRKSLGISDNDIVIGHVGNYRPIKNHKFILKLFENLNSRIKNAKLVLVGANVEENLKKQAIDLGVDDKVLFLGARSDVSSLLQAFDIFVLPSISEGLGISLIEAQASGLKCFVSENIPKEAEVTDNIYFLPIKNVSDIDLWSDKIVEEIGYNRENMKSEIEKNGYDIIETVKYLEQFYLRISKDKNRSNIL